ncbi:MAG: hypothetical protein LAO56_23430 [Acidobacteriia bacterium]|nr:hypothetical protein [Terriglobia bacterium]
MPNKTARPIVILILGLPIFIAAAVFGPSAIDLVISRRPPERYVIPAGYSGWVRVDFRQPGTPALPIEDGHRLLRLNAEGKLQTSSDPRPGHGKDEFLAASPAGRTKLSNAGVCKGGMIWGVETMVEDRTGKPFERFFVGTEDQYRHEVDPDKKLPACE